MTDPRKAAGTSWQLCLSFWFSDLQFHHGRFPANRTLVSTSSSSSFSCSSSSVSLSGLVKNRSQHPAVASGLPLQDSSHRDPAQSWKETELLSQNPSTPQFSTQALEHSRISQTCLRSLEVCTPRGTVTQVTVNQVTALGAEESSGELGKFWGD